MTQRRWAAFLRKTPKIALPPHTHANMHAYVCTLRSKTKQKHRNIQQKRENRKHKGKTSFGGASFWVYQMAEAEAGTVSSL